MKSPALMVAVILLAAASFVWPDVPVSSGMVLQMEVDARTVPIALKKVEDKGTYAIYFFETDRVPSCGTVDGEPVGAIPLQGTWDETMRWSEKGMTLACTNGPIGKCVTWGYVQWQEELRDLHQACVRMVRADYCGTGIGQTKDGTPIDVWDILGINVRANVEDMTLEAEWDANGATVVHRARFDFGMEYVRENCPDRIASGQEDRIDKPGGLISNGSYP